MIKRKKINPRYLALTKKNVNGRQLEIVGTSMKRCKRLKNHWRIKLKKLMTSSPNLSYVITNLLALITGAYIGMKQLQASHRMQKNFLQFLNLRNHQAKKEILSLLKKISKKIRKGKNNRIKLNK